MSAGVDIKTGARTLVQGGDAQEQETAGKRTLTSLAQQGVAGTGEPLPHADKIQAAFGGAHDVSSIRAHVGGAAAVASKGMGAEAYAHGNAVAFGGAPSLHTAAHEAAHVIQQRRGVALPGGVGAEGDAYERQADAVADRVVAGQSAADLLPDASEGAGAEPAVQMRRLPANTGALLSDPADATRPGANIGAHSRGVRRLIELAEEDLSAAERAQVDTETLGGQTQSAFDALPEHTRLTRRVEAIRRVRPDLTLGDPMLIDVGPRPGTADAANLATLVGGANAIFDAIAGGAHDTDLDQVFGPTNQAAAKRKYASGKTWMNTLHTTNHIVTDRSGYNDEVGLGGLTGFQSQIALSPQTLDTPSDVESVLTMIHEALHAGNDDVSDKGYIGTQVFTQLPEAVKLTNAAHFEVVPRRILGASHAYAGQTFTPAGAAPAGGGAATAPLTAMQNAVRDASERIRLAWTMGLNLHSQYHELYKDQSQWPEPRLGGSFRDGVPYWSKVQRLTIHRKSVVDASSADPARRPISDIDMALSEGVTRKLALAMDAIGSVPNADAAATTFLQSHATAAEIATAQATRSRHRDLWVKVARRIVGSITGSEQRDVRVIGELAGLYDFWGTAFRRRNLDVFPE